MIDFLLDYSVTLVILIPIGGWAYQFWRSHFATNGTEGVDLVARWCHLQRRRAGKGMAYFEDKYEHEEDKPSQYVLNHRGARYPKDRLTLTPDQALKMVQATSNLGITEKMKETPQ